jgi:hypothetical protein
MIARERGRRGQASDRSNRAHPITSGRGRLRRGDATSVPSSRQGDLYFGKRKSHPLSGAALARARHRSLARPRGADSLIQPTMRACHQGRTSGIAASRRLPGGYRNVPCQPHRQASSERRRFGMTALGSSRVSHGATVLPDGSGTAPSRCQSTAIGSRALSSILGAG